MYLMAFNNSDYVLATLFFGLIFITAYLFRRKQKTASEFLFADKDGTISQYNSWILGFGVIELVAAGALGAIYGFSGLYRIFVVILIGFIVLYYLSQRIYPSSVYEYLSQKVGPKFSAIFAILCVLLLLFWLSITVVLTSKLFLSLLGWNFVNSIFGLTLLTIICVEVGGYAGIRYNRGIWLLVVIAGFVLVTALALQAIPFNSGIANLEQLALNQGKYKNLYTSFNYSLHLTNIIGASISVLVMLPLITSIKVSRRVNFIPITILKIILFSIMVICGILAIETPAKNMPGNANSKIITYQAQLPDGQVGYVIKSVAASGAAKNSLPGIVPALLNDKTSLVETDRYDYKLSNLVVFRHYLPAKLMFLVVFTIMALYMYAVSSYLLAIAKIITFDICPPLNWLTEYKEEGKLWCSRMSVVFAGAIAIFGGYFLQLWFNLIALGYIAFAFAGILALILIAVAAKNGKK